MTNLSHDQLLRIANMLMNRSGFHITSKEEMEKIVSSDKEFCKEFAANYPTDMDNKADDGIDTFDRETILYLLATYLGASQWPDVIFMQVDDYIALKTMTNNAEKNENIVVQDCVYDSLKTTREKIVKTQETIEEALSL